MSGGAPEKFRFEALDFDKHDVAGFWSGNGKLDAYLKRHAQREMAKRVAVVMVLTRDGKTIDGYYRLQQLRVDRSQIDDHRKISEDKVQSPNSVLLRLAPSWRAERRLIWKLLLMGALKNLRNSSFRCEAVVVQARDENAVYFYEQIGFWSFHDYEHHMFLPMGVVEQIFAAAAEPGKDDRKKSEHKKKNEWDHGCNPPDDEDAEPFEPYANGLARFWRKRAG